MWGCEDIVAGAVDVLCLADGETAPKHENDAVASLGKSLDGGIGEQFPASVLVRPCLMGTHGECGVEQEDTLVGPADEIAAGERNVGAEVAIDFLNDIDQRGRDGNAGRHGETETGRLTGLMIGVLT